MQKAGISVLFPSESIKVVKGNIEISTGMMGYNLPCKQLSINSVNKNCTQVNIVKNNTYELWHQGLGDSSKSKFLELKNKLMKNENDMELIKQIVPKDDLCELLLFDLVVK